MSDFAAHTHAVLGRRLGVLLVALVLGALAPRASAQFVYVTDFTKTNNIYTNLNEEFPGSGVGVPGSGVGTANASFIFDPSSYTSPDYVAGSNLATNGVSFDITSDASGRDFSEINGGASLVVPINQQMSTAYLLMSAYVGTYVTVTFTGADGATETFSNVWLPDFNGGGVMNLASAVNGSPTNNFFEQTVLQVHNVGAGGTGNSTTGAYNYYDLVEPTFVLDSQLASEPVTSVTLTSSGYMTLFLGMSFTPVPEPSTWALLACGVGLVSGVAWSRIARERRA